MRTVTLGVVQCALGGSLDDNLEVLSGLVRQAANRGANIILTPELMEGPYFCKTQEEGRFAQAFPMQEHPAVKRFQGLARDLGVVVPVSVFERDGPHYFNSIAMISDTGEILGTYRKSHIPDGPGYQEKFYFRPGNTGFRVWHTRFGKLGVGICWDQWFPEAARAMALQGAEVLLYPTAIGSEPHAPAMDTKDRWQRAMQGHAVSNVVPVAAANRIGTEDGQVFYGSSFITDAEGAVVGELGRTDAGVLVQQFNLDDIAEQRAAWGFFRDRRPDLYGDLLG